MNQLLRIGATVQTEVSTHPCYVEQFLGGGGQGEVYRVSLDGQSLALKWYFPHQATPEQKKLIQALINHAAPDARFLWPMAVAKAPQVNGFGYLMPLRESRFKSIADLMKRRIEPSFRALATAGFQLADSFFQLHAKGLCYRDISFGNVFFDPNSGDVCICDNDNVSVDGAKSSIGGTIGFMAPEIVRAEAAPSTATDLFSLAVLLFYMFMVHHPLEGRKEADIRCFDMPAKNKLYGSEPLFIFDPFDTANRPVPGYHDNAIAFWPLYPQFLRDFFIQAFTKGLHDPLHGRVRESEWRLAMIRLRDAILYCAQCGAENFYVADDASASTCWACHRDIRLPPRLCIANQTIMLNHDTQLAPHHLDANRSFDFSEVVAEVAQHPSNPDLWGLKNLSKQSWRISSADGSSKDVPPGRSVSLTPGMRIDFAEVTGEIRI